jgi:transposase
VHHVCDGRGRPLVVLVGPGQAHDGPMLPRLLTALTVPRLGPGRARTRPDRVLADRAYSSRGTRTLLRSRGIVAVIPEPRDQQANRKRRGQRGGRPVTYDAVAYKGRNVVERSFNTLKNWRGLATRYDKLAVLYRGGAVLAAILAWLRG